MKRVLVTGAAGFVGRHCLPRLVEAGYRVHAVTSGPSRPLPPTNPDYVTWHRADLLAPGEPERLVEECRPTHLLHLAWCTTPGSYWTSPENLRWVEASLALLRSFTEGSGRRAVLTGSCAEYDWSGGLCAEGTTPLAPATFYGRCKHALSEIALGYAEQVELSLAWGRLFFLYGPYEHPARLVPSVIRSLLAGEPARCTDGEQVRDFLHAADAAAALVALLESPVTGAVNVASGAPVPVKEVIRIAAEHSRRPDLVQLGALPRSASDPPRLLADVHRLREEVGWEPSLSLQAGLAETVDWWKAGGLG